MEKSIKSNVDSVKARIEAAALKTGRVPGEVKLLAATKNRSTGLILEAFDAGVKVFGENRVQELVDKVGEVGEEADWHFIGHLQRNKVKAVTAIVSLIHSVDSLKLAREIDKRAWEAGKNQAILLQVNVAGEESKFGIAPEDVGELLDELYDLNNIDIKGLSTIAPLVDDPEDVRWVFRELKRLGQDLGVSKGNFSCAELSMGMTGDFEVAVEEGSTIVRVGTAIFDID